MKVFVASLSHETSSFSPITTSRTSFEEFDYYRPVDGKPDDKARTLSGYGRFVTKAEENCDEVYCSTYTWAQPSGPCNRQDYEELRDEVLNDLARSGPFDMVFLFLHGAQMANGYDDCEGDLLTRARAIVGADVFIGVLLDLHANVSDTMIAQADILAACREYPHVDYVERAEELFDIAVYCRANGIKPVAQIKRIPMMGLFYTTLPRMKALNVAADGLQGQDGVLSTSVIHGFQWADVPFRGAAVLGYAQTSEQSLDQELRHLAGMFIEARDESKGQQWPMTKVLKSVEEADVSAGKPVTIADFCDNPGGGNGSDSTFILEAVLEQGLTGYAFALFWDPVVVSLAMAAGKGAEANFRVGGKTGPCAGRPLDVKARVIGVCHDMAQYGIGYHQPAGDSVALEIAGNVIIVNSIRGQVFSPSVFTDLGVDPSDWKALVVKSTQHFYDQYAPISSGILYCQTPGGMSSEILETLDMKHLKRPVWPLDDFDIMEAIE